MFKKMLVAAGFAMMANAAFAIGPVSIDDFSEDQFTTVTLPPILGGGTLDVGVVANTATPVNSGQVPAGGGATTILGGFRDIVAQHVSGDGNVEGLVKNGRLIVNSSSGTAGNVFVTWDGANPVTTPGGAGVDIDGLGPLNLGGASGTEPGVDLTGGGFNTGIFLDTLNDPNNFDLRFTVWDMDGRQAAVQNSVTGSGIQEFFFDFTAFADPLNILGNVDIDLTHVGAVQMGIFGTNALDLEANIVLAREDVPVPATLALFGLGLLGFSLRKKQVEALPA